MKNPYAQAPTSEVNYSRYPLAPASTSHPPAYQSDADADDSYVENLYDEGDRIAAERTPQVEDSPSCYSDPYEYQSTVAGLGRQGTQRSQRPGSRYLHRNGTLLPGDSISEYNVPAPTSRRSHDPMPEQDRRADYLYGNAAPPAAGPSSDGHGHYDDYYQYQQPYDGSGVAAQDYAYDDGAGYKSTYGTAMYAEAPYDSAAAPYSSSKHAHSQSHATTNADFDMVYSTGQGNAYDYDDDDDYYRAKSQQEHAAAYPPQPPPPGLFANDLAQANGLAPKSHFSMFAPGDAAGASEGQRKNFLDHDEDDSAGAKTRRLFGVNDGSSLAEQIERRRRGIGRQRWPIVTWAFALAFASVFIAEIVKAKAGTGQAIQTKPYFNPMIGPSAQFLISFGARYVPCMRNTPAVPLSTPFACLNSTSATSTVTCPLYEICGLPNDHTYGQSYRLISAMFLHAGVVHILFNMIVQLTLCAQIERLLGSPYYLLVYVAGGIGGNLLGGNFGLVATPSVGASGAIYGCIAVELVDLAYNWRYEYRAKTRLAMSIVFTLVGLALGLLPGLDNFAHIGGLAVGLLGGMALAPSIHQTRTHRNVVWGLRVLACVALAAFFAALTLNFYRSDDPTKACTWCRYLSCLPTFKQCQNGGLQMTSTTSQTSRRSPWMG